MHGDEKGRGSEEEIERAPQHPLQDGRGVGHAVAALSHGGGALCMVDSSRAGVTR